MSTNQAALRTHRRGSIMRRTHAFSGSGALAIRAGGVALMFLAALATSTTPARAQVADVTVQPVDIRIRAGETTEVLASAFDRNGNLVSGVEFSWRSSDPSIVTVESDPSIPELAILRGIGPGLALIELRVGNLTRSIPVLVQGERQPAQPRPVVPAVPTLADTVMAGGVENRARNLAARIRAFPFGIAPSCASGAFVGRGGLLITTYRAIRGANRLEVEVAGRTIGDVQVAHYDARRDIAILRVGAADQLDSLPLASDVVDDQIVWAFGYADCGPLTSRRMRVASWENRPTGLLRLTTPLSATEQGTALVTQTGDFAGIALGDATAVPGPVTSDLLNQARTNLRLNALLSTEDVGRRENHLFGSLAISSGVAGTIARVRPLEAWQWPETQQQGLTPYTYSGPVGRYTVELVQNGQVVQSTTAVVRSGMIENVALAVPVAAQPQLAVPQQKGGGFPWPIAVLGVAGAGAAAFFLTQSKQDSIPNGGGPGSITIRVPNP
jgi:hypothetical protein